MNFSALKKTLDRLAKAYGRSPSRDLDPVGFIHRYRSWRDREIAGFLASCLAYGRVETILKSVGAVLRPLGGHPAAFLLGPRSRIDRLYGGFSHRLNTGSDIRLLLGGLSAVLREYGSLRDLFILSLVRAGQDLLSAQAAFMDVLRTEVLKAASLRKADPGRVLHLLPDPAAGSACKRLNLFLKWMIRRDAVDPGVWFPRLGHLRARLIIPLDTHIARAGRRHRMTCRKSDDVRTAVEITEFLRRLDPSDPLRYDFCLCHEGMERHRKRPR
jgi:uncharacterized protein (TIGR02757 family)